MDPVPWYTSDILPTVYVYLRHNQLFLPEYSPKLIFWNNFVCICPFKHEKTRKRAQFSTQALTERLLSVWAKLSSHIIHHGTNTCVHVSICCWTSLVCVAGLCLGNEPSVTVSLAPPTTTTAASAFWDSHFRQEEEETEDGTGWPKPSRWVLKSFIQKTVLSF